MMRKLKTNFIPQNIATNGAEKITIYDMTGKKVCNVSLGRLKQPTGTKLYSFLAISDVHVQYDTAASDLQRALIYAEENCDFTCICGDLTQNGTDAHLTEYKNIVSAYTKPIYAVGGNHDSIPADMTSSRITQFTEKPMYYSFAQGNDVFIMLSHYGKYEGEGIGWLSSKFVSADELQWLYETLEENRNKRCFIFNHVYPYEDGVGDAGRYYNGRNWLTTDGGIGQAFASLLKHYKNTVLFHGHSHLRFHLQEVDRKANYSDEVGYRSVHIPSLAVPRDIVGSGIDSIYSESEGYVVDVYDDYIILNGRDFIDNDADGHLLPIATYKIDTTLQTVEANTFVDSTGTIITK